MAGKIMQEAIDEADFERQERGLPPIPRKKEVKPEPKSPIVDSRLELAKIPMDEIVAVMGCKRRAVRNEDKAIFIGFDVSLQMKKGNLTGWMSEADFINFRRILGEKVNPTNILM